VDGDLRAAGATVRTPEPGAHMNEAARIAQDRGWL
jgi:hypothetical protein